MVVTNSDQCTKYADIECNYTMQEDAVFEEDKGYVFMIRITAKNGADINVWEQIEQCLMELQ